ncbi:TPA: hypothetical protein ACUA5P_001609 [Escherichia coli]|nr:MULTISPECIES: hypothetical protein [Escherichia]MCZ6948699.1 hypothetical protein [Escherichia coli]
MKKKAAEKISTAFASPATLLDATLPRRIRHEADYFLISYSGV